MRHKSVPRDTAVKTAKYCLRVLRRISRTALSDGSLLLNDLCLIFVPFGHYDEPKILPFANTSICPKDADVRQSAGSTGLAVKVSGFESGMAVIINMDGKTLQANSMGCGAGCEGRGGPRVWN